MPFFAKSVKASIFFKSKITITCRNVNAIVTCNFAQIVKKATCLMTITQYNSNSLTSSLKKDCSKKEIIWMNLLKQAAYLGLSFILDVRILLNFLNGNNLYLLRRADVHRIALIILVCCKCIYNS